jgi:short-subunit dehydrogenase
MEAQDITRAALVTGGSSGIGLAIAHVLARQGYALTIAGRDARRLTRAAAQLRGHGAPVRIEPADVADATEVRRLVAGHRAAWGRLDVLVHSAGTILPEPIAQLTPAAIDAQFAVNVRAAMLLYHEAGELLRAAGREHGRALVVNVASIVAHAPLPHEGVYAASKAALVAWTRAMNAELGGDGVKSIALCPALVDTPMTEGDDVPPAEMMRATDVAAAVAYALSLSPQCVVPEIVFQRPAQGDGP